jgi:carboxyl-terminal processing protease
VNPFGFFAYDEIRKLNESVKILKKMYYENFDNAVLADGAIWGIANSLKDPYTEYMNTQTAENFKKNVEGNFSGVGLYISKGEDGLITVITPIEDSPACNAGISSGDKIISIDGKEVNDVTEASNLMLGEPNTTVSLTIFKNITSEKIDLTLTRANISLKSIKHEIRDKIGYIRIIQFSTNTYNEFKSAMDEIKKENIEKLIIDLRNNPGGMIESVVNILNLFIEENKNMVFTIDKYGKKIEYKATKGEKNEFNCVILINEGSASASEIFAGCMKDYGKGVLIGKKTFGKGVVQQVIEFFDKSLIKVTVSKYYTPNEICIDKEGIKPDIEVKTKENKSLECILEFSDEDEFIKCAIEFFNRKCP